MLCLRIRAYQRPASSLTLAFFSVALFACFTTYVMMRSSSVLAARSNGNLLFHQRSFDSTFGVPDCYAKWNASQLSQDSRGWVLDPIAASSRAGISGAAKSCKSVHVGQIKPGSVRGNHRHHFCNETFVIWGARTQFRAEDPLVKDGYVDVIFLAHEVAVVGSPAGCAHALLNIDEDEITYFVACQDAVGDEKFSETDHNVWAGL